MYSLNFLTYFKIYKKTTIYNIFFKKLPDENFSIRRIEPNSSKSLHMRFSLFEYFLLNKKKYNLKYACK